FPGVLAVSAGRDFRLRPAAWQAKLRALGARRADRSRSFSTRGFSMHYDLFLRLLVTLAVVQSVATTVAYGESVVTWASDPVRPDETVLVRGAGFGTQPAVSFASMADGDPLTAPAGASTWITLPALQASDDALKFTI